MQIVITINSMDLYERNYNPGINKTPSLDILRGTSEGATITIVNWLEWLYIFCSGISKSVLRSVNPE